jgi:hypothetical protein
MSKGVGKGNGYRWRKHKYNWILCKGSSINLRGGEVHYAERQQQDALEKGDLVRLPGNRGELTQDLFFRSPSNLADFAEGRSARGGDFVVVNADSSDQRKTLQDFESFPEEVLSREFTIPHPKKKDINVRIRVASDVPRITSATPDAAHNAWAPVEPSADHLRPFFSSEAFSSQRDLEEAQRVGLLGEKLVDNHFARDKDAGKIRDFKWISRDDHFAPADFSRTLNNGNNEWAEVKATGEKFGTTFFVSRAELDLACKGTPYRIYRVYEIGDQGGKAQVSTNFEALAQAILDSLAGLRLPAGVTVSSVRIDPAEAGISFGPEICLAPLKAADG